MQLHIFGKRLREERERLGLSQEAFGALGGVKKLTQLKYEKGERAPDAVYLAAITAKNVDINYLLTGKRLEVEALMDDAAAHHHLLIMIALKIGIDTDAMERLIFDAWKNEERRTAGKAVDDAAIGQRLDELLAQSTLARNEGIDPELLSEVMETTENILKASNITLPISKKARVIALLYRTFFKNKKVDEAVVQDAILVAAE